MLFFVRLGDHVLKWQGIQVNDEISDPKNSALMALDFIGTAIESRSKNPITIGGRANRRYRDYLNTFVPEEYEPQLDKDVRTAQYYKAMDLKVSKSNVYIAWAVTFLGWLCLPFTLSINLFRYIMFKLSS